MDVSSVLATVVKDLNLLDPNGKLVELDSMSMVDLVLALEQAVNINIPSSALSPENFATLQSIEILLKVLAG